jgi:hypothetical protein
MEDLGFIRTVNQTEQLTPKSFANDGNAPVLGLDTVGVALTLFVISAKVPKSANFLNPFATCFLFLTYAWGGSIPAGCGNCIRT